MQNSIKLEKSGLPLILTENRLEFGQEMKKNDPKARLFDDLLPVLLEKKNPSGNHAAYFMYRDVCLEKDRAKILENGLRYDLTVIPPALIGKEYVKTFGHSHPLANGTGFSFPEVYEVVFGRGHFVLQSDKDFFAIEAGAGEKILIPPNMMHVTINPIEKTLVVANWVEKNFESNYSEMKEKNGAAFFETTEGWVKNKKHEQEFSFHSMRAKNVPEFGLEKNKPMYNLVNEIEKLEFLKKPQEFKEVFEKYLNM